MTARCETAQRCSGARPVGRHPRPQARLMVSAILPVSRLSHAATVTSSRTRTVTVTEPVTVGPRAGRRRCREYQVH